MISHIGEVLNVTAKLTHTHIHTLTHIFPKRVCESGYVRSDKLGMTDWDNRRLLADNISA